MGSTEHTGKGGSCTPSELIFGAVSAVEVVQVERHVALRGDTVREGRQPHACEAQ